MKLLGKNITCKTDLPFVSLILRDASCIDMLKGLPPLDSLPSQNQVLNSPKLLTLITVLSPHQDRKATLS
jgi:hypothetical protein